MILLLSTWSRFPSLFFYLYESALELTPMLLSMETLPYLQVYVYRTIVTRYCFVHQKKAKDIVLLPLLHLLCGIFNLLKRCRENYSAN